MKKPFCLCRQNLLPVLLCLSFVIPSLIFTGCEKIDDIRPPVQLFHVTATTPQSEQPASPFDSDIVATLDTFIDSTAFEASVLLVQSGSVITGKTAVRDSNVYFSSDTNLLPATHYTAALTITAKTTGAVFFKYEWGFTTKCPDEYIMTKRSEAVTNFNRDGTRCMQIGNWLYSFGGWTDDGGVAAVYSDAYRSRGNLSIWEKRVNAPWHGRHVYGLVKLNGFTYVVGGDPWQPAFDVWRTADGENWTLLSQNQLGNRVLYGCAAHNGYIYVAGGEGYSDVWRSRDGIKWEQVAANTGFLKGENFAGSLTSFNGKLWVVCGGGDGWGSGTPRKEVWSSTDGKIWKQEPDFAGTGRNYTDICVWDNKLWVVGGYNYTEGNTKSIWYMKHDGTWVEYHTPDNYIGRHATGLAVYNNTLAITCGNYNNDCWVIEKAK
jgi:hypothetical protein